MERTKRIKGEGDIKISKALYEFFREQGKIGVDMKSLYEHYLYTAGWQETDQPRSVNSYCMRALHWGKPRLLRAKKALMDVGLISQIQYKSPDGIFGKYFIVINRDWSNSQSLVNTSFKGAESIQTPIKSPSVSKNDKQTPVKYPSVLKPTVGSSTVNALRIKNNPPPPEESEEDENNFTNNGKICISHFKQFWNIYPKHLNKSEAFIVWKDLCIQKDRPQFKELIRAVIAQKKSEQWKKDPRFISYPVNWLKNKRWLDDPKGMTGVTRPDEVCPIGWNFGKDFSDLVGCQRCEDDYSKTYLRCKVAYKKHSQETSNVTDHSKDK